MQLADELARRSLKERTDKQAVGNDELFFPGFKSDYQVLIRRPYNEADGPNPKLSSPWQRPHTVREHLSPVTSRVSKDSEPAETTVHHGRIKELIVPESSSDHDLETLDMFSGATLPVPDLERSPTTVTIGPYTAEDIDGHKRGVGAIGPCTVEGTDGHKRGVGAASLNNFQLSPQAQGSPSSAWRVAPLQL